MMHGFTVIEGGRIEGGRPDRATASPTADAIAPAPVAQDWRVDLHRVGGIDDGAVAAWRALMVRNAVADPRADPDYLLSAARHQSGGRTIAFALAWDREGDGRDTLQGVLPMVMPHPIWGRARARAWQPPGLPQPAGLIDGHRAEGIDAAIRGRLSGLRRPLRLASATRAPSGCPSFSRGDALRPALAAPAEPRAIPADRFVGVRAAVEAVAGEVEHVSDPAGIAAAVEAFLVLDARTAARPIIADPSEASMVRVVTRLFARRGQVRVELARRAGELVAGTLHLGAGARALVWRHAARA